MNYLHKSFVGPHGHLTTMTCVVDSRYECKITDYGVNWLRDRYRDPDNDDDDAVGENVDLGRCQTTDILGRFCLPIKSANKIRQKSANIVLQKVDLDGSEFACRTMLLVDQSSSDFVR